MTFIIFPLILFLIYIYIYICMYFYISLYIDYIWINYIFEFWRFVLVMIFV